MHDEVFEEVRLLSMRTIEDYVKTIMNLGEHLEPVELTTINIEISAEAKNIQQEKIKTVLDIQLLLSNVKNSIKIADLVLYPAVEIIFNHSKRLMKIKNIVLAALENKIKINDIKLNVTVLIIFQNIMGIVTLFYS